MGGLVGRLLLSLPYARGGQNGHSAMCLFAGLPTTGLLIPQSTEADDVPTHEGVCFLSSPCLFFSRLLVSTQSSR